MAKAYFTVTKKHPSLHDMLDRAIRKENGRRGTKLTRDEKEDLDLWALQISTCDDDLRCILAMVQARIDWDEMVKRDGLPDTTPTLVYTGRSWND